MRLSVVGSNQKKYQDAANNSILNSAESAGYSGFAKTIKAYQLIWPLMQQWNNGIRIDVADPLNPGPILDRGPALTEIRAILAEGNSELQGSEFAFTLTSGWDGFNTPRMLNSFLFDLQGSALKNVFVKRL